MKKLTVILAVAVLSTVLNIALAETFTGGLTVNVNGSVTWYVDDMSDPDEDGSLEHPFDAIQEAIDTANAGDTIVVLEGSYFENIVLPGMNDIKLISQNGPDTTIIDGSGENKSVIDVANNTNDFEICGFTITGGIGSYYIRYMGGGIIVRDNSSGLIKDCKVTGNGTLLHPDDAARGYGTYGSVFIGRNSNVTIEKCEVYGNTTDEVGGVWYRNFTSDGVMKNCLIYDNYCEWGGAVFCQHSPVKLINNTISNNNSDGLCFYYPWPTVKNNIISSNSKYAIWSNDPDDTNLITNNNVWGNLSGDYIYPNMHIIGQNGNISEDPLFVSLNSNDFHLLAGSACIDTGDNSMVDPGATDLDGNERINNGIVDMGAYEFFVPNAVPVADAGADVTAYAWIDGFAQVKLDGTGSYDEDGDELEYFWYNDANDLIATGAEPNAIFGVGEHVVRLIVNDDIEDSEPNSCVVTVVEAMETTVRMLPRTINLTSKRQRVIGRIELAGEQEPALDPDQPMLMLVGQTQIEAKRQMLVYSEDDVMWYLVGFFDRAEVEGNLTASSEAEIMFVHRFESGQWVHGADAVRVQRSRRVDNSHRMRR